ncbi:MAG: hypothetical protein KGS45_00910 [Planctomycetes bacterium]|nr:hypothetical protein [Planctomycetota bacterium]
MTVLHTPHHESSSPQSCQGWVACIVGLAGLILSRPALGAPQFFDVPGVGPTSAWEFPGQRAFLDRIDRLIEARTTASPVIRSRVRYICQDPAGDGRGGGGDGLTPATAYRCKNMMDVRQVVYLALNSPDTSVLFRCGDTFFAAPSQDWQGLPHMPFGRYSFGSYVDPARPSSAKPRLLGFVPVTIDDSWIYASPTTRQGPYIFEPYWVRSRPDNAEPGSGFRVVPYHKNSDLFLVPSFSGSFAWSSASQQLAINIPAGHTAVEACIARGPGVLVYNVDDVRIDGLIFEGWGMEAPTSTFSAITFYGSYGQSIHVSNCEWAWTAYHGFAHIATDGEGGIATLTDCTFGLHTQRTTAQGGGGDGAVSFANRGQNEFVLVNCRGFAGGLRRVGQSGADSLWLGMPTYIHTAGEQPIGLHVRKNCTFSSTIADRARYVDYNIGSDAIVNLLGQRVNEPADPSDIRSYRSFIINESADLDFGPAGGSWRGVDINCRINLAVQNAPRAYFWGVANASPHGISINRDINITLPIGFSGLFAMSEVLNPHKTITLHQRLRLTGSPISSNEIFRAEVQAARLSLTRHYNSIFSNELSSNLFTLNYPNSNPDTAYGGAGHCGYFAINPSFYSQTRSPVVASAAPDFPLTDAGRDTIPGQLRFAASTSMGNSPQGPIVVQYDALGLTRGSTPTIGPLEATSVFCPADFNRDQVVDFFDYLDFVDALATQHPAADYNLDGIIDFFDYLDFVADFSAGC